MSINQIQAAVTAKVWQAVAQSEVDVSGIEREALNKLVDIMVNAALEEVDAQLDVDKSSVQAAQTAPADDGEDDDDEEEILWQGRPFLSLTRHYTITSQRIRITEGLLGKVREDVELVRVQDIDHKQSMTERAFNLGDIHIASHDPNKPQLVLENIKNPQDVHEVLRRAVLKARQKYRLNYREEM